MSRLLSLLGNSIPIIQAPMAGVSTPEMAAAVSNAGGLGSIGIGNLDVGAARATLAEVRTRTDRPFNVNLFCHEPAVADPNREAAWLTRLTPHFAQFDAVPPSSLREIYRTFLGNEEMLSMLLEEKPPIVSFHFGLPSTDYIHQLSEAGIRLLATATNLAEGQAIVDAGIHGVVAQGYEAGGHRGMFEPSTPDERLGTLALTRLLVKQLSIPVIAAGDIMDGAGVAASLTLGAEAAQLGTAFILCPESAADAGYRQVLTECPTRPTVMTSAISGRPARAIANRFTELGADLSFDSIPSYPIAYDAGKALHAVAKTAGENGYGAHWAGQGVALARNMPAGDLVKRIWQECQETISHLGKRNNT